MNDHVPAFLMEALAEASAILIPALRRAVRDARSHQEIVAIGRTYSNALFSDEVREAVEARQRELDVEHTPAEVPPSESMSQAELHDNDDMRVPYVDLEVPTGCAIP
ncbi:MAG: hypothetical protein IT372_11470 [Polyangiaceae bacterium]|nr:hypothetical protein [Polyangiaceae bacterium]